MGKSVGHKRFLGAALAAVLLFPGCGGSENSFVRTGTSTVLSGASPVAQNDSFNAIGNATLNQAATGVLANDTPNGATISAFDSTGSRSGTLVLNQDGSFAYTPATGFIGTETFNYTLGGSAGLSTATITFTSTGKAVFVDNTAAAGGNGSQSAPFNNLAAAVAAASSGDTIFVSRGDGTTQGLTGAVNLPSGVDLVGEGTGLILAQTVLPAGTAPVITGPINCGGNNEIKGFTISGASGNALSANGVSNITVENNTITNPGARSILFTNVGGTVNIVSNTFSSPANDNEDWIQLNNNNTNATFAVTDNTFQNSPVQNTEDLCQMELTGTSVATCNFSRNRATSDTADSFDFGLFLSLGDTAQVTATVADNMFKGFESVPLELCPADSGTVLQATVSGNTIENVSGDNGIAVDGANGLITISGNTLTNISDDGIDIDGFGFGGSYIVESNTVTGAGDDGIDYEGTPAADTVALRIRSNIVTNSSSDAIDVDTAATSGTLCVDLSGNIVDRDIDIDNFGGGTVQVEQLSTLSSVNTLNSGAMIGTNTGTVTEVPDGTCIF